MQNEFDKKDENVAAAAAVAADIDIEAKNKEENVENKSEENTEENVKVKTHINKNPNMSSPLVENPYSVYPVIEKNLEEAEKLQKTQSVDGSIEVEEVVEKTEELEQAAEAEEVAESDEIKEIKSDLADAIKENNIREIFDYFDIGVFMYRDGTCGLSEYRQPYEDMTYADIGIDEERLLEDVVKISGNADFRKSDLKGFGKIKYIGGYADFRDSNFTLKTKLPKIGAKIVFYDNQTLFQGIIIKIITSIRRLFK